MHARVLKLSENPPVLSPAGTASVRDVPGTWAVAHTRARFEKALAWDLVRANVAYFLPLTQRVRFSGGRKRKVLMPLFPGYVFFCGDPQQSKIAVLQTDRVSSVIAVSDQKTFVDELPAIERVVAGNAELDMYPFAAVGKRCRITAGPF